MIVAPGPPAVAVTVGESVALAIEAPTASAARGHANDIGARLRCQASRDEDGQRPVDLAACRGGTDRGTDRGRRHAAVTGGDPPEAAVELAEASSTPLAMIVTSVPAIRLTFESA